MSATNIQQIVQFIVQRADIQASEGKMLAHGRRRMPVDVHATQNWRKSTFVSIWVGINYYRTYRLYAYNDFPTDLTSPGVSE